MRWAFLAAVILVVLAIPIATIADDSVSVVSVDDLIEDIVSGRLADEGYSVNRRVLMQLLNTLPTMLRYGYTIEGLDPMWPTRYYRPGRAGLDWLEPLTNYATQMWTLGCEFNIPEYRVCWPLIHCYDWPTLTVWGQLALDGALREVENLRGWHFNAISGDYEYVVGVHQRLVINKILAARLCFCSTGAFIEWLIANKPILDLFVRELGFVQIIDTAQSHLDDLVGSLAPMDATPRDLGAYLVLVLAQESVEFASNPTQYRDWITVNELLLRECLGDETFGDLLGYADVFSQWDYCGLRYEELDEGFDPIRYVLDYVKEPPLEALVLSPN
jgi:hypothetical protein